MAMSRADRLRDAAPVRWSLAASLGGWMLATLLSQHPHRGFDRLREHEPFGLLLPNWRFFAPEPSQHDYHVLHRVLTAEGQQTEWVESIELVARTWGQTVWFPKRRQGKAVSDIATELLQIFSTTSVDVSVTVPYRLLRDHVELLVREEWRERPLPQGFQFLIARHTGHDEAHDPEYLLASAFVPLTTET
jgi:hypothetical protein